LPRLRIKCAATCKGCYSPVGAAARERDRSPTFKPRRLMTSEFTREDGSGANWALKPSLAILFENRTAQTTELLENQLINTLFAFILGTRQHRPPTKNVSEIHFVDSTWSEGISCVSIVGREILSTVKTTSSCQVLAYSLTAPPRTASNSRRVVCYVSGAPLGIASAKCFVCMLHQF